MDFLVWRINHRATREVVLQLLDKPHHFVVSDHLITKYNLWRNVSDKMMDMRDVWKRTKWPKNPPKTIALTLVVRYLARGLTNELLRFIHDPFIRKLFDLNPALLYRLNCDAEYYLLIQKSNFRYDKHMSERQYPPVERWWRRREGCNVFWGTWKLALKYNVVTTKMILHIINHRVNPYPFMIKDGEWRRLLDREWIVKEIFHVSCESLYDDVSHEDVLRLGLPCGASRIMRMMKEGIDIIPFMERKNCMFEKYVDKIYRSYQSTIPYKWRVDRGFIHHIPNYDEKRREVLRTIRYPEANKISFNHIIECFVLYNNPMDHIHDTDAYILIGWNKHLYEQYVTVLDPTYHHCIDLGVNHYNSYDDLMDDLIGGEWWNDTESVDSWHYIGLWEQFEATTKMVLHMLNNGFSGCIVEDALFKDNEWKPELDRDVILNKIVQLDMLYIFKNYYLEDRLRLELPYDESRVWNKHLETLWPAYQMVDIWNMWTTY